MPAGGGGTPSFVNNANRALGRISGPLLADNLLRNGVDLAFETQLLYFDVKNKRIGVKSIAFYGNKKRIGFNFSSIC